MTLAAIILLIVVGIVLIIVEFFIFPGVTIAGIGGIAMLIAAVYLSYSNYGSSIGNFTLIGVLLFMFGSVAFALRAKTWDKVTLKKAITEKLNDEVSSKIKAGDKGITISRLAPMGKVLINNEYYEVKAQNLLVDEGEEIEVIRVEKDKIIVKKT